VCVDRVGCGRCLCLFCAATHDIGKTLHVGELSGPGSSRELAGYELLASRGVEPRLTRFARDHASWSAGDFEGLLVSLADKVWKAKRVPELEQLVTDGLVSVSDQEPWQVLMALDDELTPNRQGRRRAAGFPGELSVEMASGPRNPA
jgi:hypothetical protein